MKLASPHHDRDGLMLSWPPRRLVDAATLPQCLGSSCEQGDEPCRDGCPNVPQARPDNTGTVDPALLHHAAGMATADTTGAELEPDPLDYVSGWRAGSWYGLLAGVMLGALIVGLAVQLGVWTGGRP